MIFRALRNEEQSRVTRVTDLIAVGNQLQVPLVLMFLGPLRSMLSW
jgi:hypothetical protein